MQQIKKKSLKLGSWSKSTNSTSVGHGLLMTNIFVIFHGARLSVVGVTVVDVTSVVIKANAEFHYLNSRYVKTVI